jgi:hypothetical protein
MAFVGVFFVCTPGCQEEKKTSTFQRKETVQESEPYFESPGEEVLE